MEKCPKVTGDKIKEFQERLYVWVKSKDEQDLLRLESTKRALYFFTGDWCWIVGEEILDEAQMDLF